jgi:hypothetical protein
MNIKHFAGHLHYWLVFYYQFVYIGSTVSFNRMDVNDELDII